MPGHLGYRRAVTTRNLADIASIPMFIKYPKGHGPTGTDDRYVRDVDVFPTIATTIGLPLPRVAGRDLQDSDYKGHDEIRVGKTFGGASARASKAGSSNATRPLTGRLRPLRLRPRLGLPCGRTQGSSDRA